MTYVLLLLTVIVVIGVTLALELLRLSSAAPKTLSPGVLKDGLSAGFRYRPLERIFSQRDFEYLSRQASYAPEMHHRLRRARRKARSLYLREMRRDFQRTWSLCRVLAPVSQDPEFGTMLVKQFAVFHGLYGFLKVRSLLGIHGYAQFDVTRIVESVNALREGAMRTLQTTDSLALQTADTYAA